MTFQDALTASLLFCAWVAFFFVIMDAHVKDRIENATAYISIFAWCVISFAVIFFSMANEEQRGPCLRYETVTAYDPATKTTRPAKHCVDRAEWIEQ